MTHEFSDRDIDEIWLDTRFTTGDKLRINYLGPTEETFYTRADILRLLEIIDGKEEGVNRV